MPVLRKPGYLHHKATGQARVRINQKDHYLGPYGSDESRARYDQLITEWVARHSVDLGHCLKVDELSLLYLEFAKGYYRKAGKQTSEVSCIRIALRHLVKLHGRCLVRLFGPKKLAEVRDEMIRQGVKRKSINLHVGRIRRMFRWAVAQEKIEVQTYQSLCALPGLEEGRSEAVESEPVLPVSQAAIDAIRPFVSDEIWAMTQFQLATGARPGEVVVIRGCDLTLTGQVWEFRPQGHKTVHHRKQRVVFVGPRGQEVLRPFLKTDLNAYLFSPREAIERYWLQRRENRRSPMTPSQAARQRKSQPRRSAGERYTTFSYRRAIVSACEQAFGMPEELRQIDKELPEEVKSLRRRLAKKWREANCWHPHQLRHNTGTHIRREAGIETARCVLGLSSVAVAEVYAEVDLDKARKVISRLG